MKICDVVLNSIWFDPRVIKQLEEYDKAGCDLYVVGLDDTKYNKSEIEKLPGHVTVVPIDRKYYREKRTLFTYGFFNLNITSTTKINILSV